MGRQCGSVTLEAMSLRDFYSRHIFFHQLWCIYQCRHSNTSSLMQIWLVIGPVLHLLMTVAILVLSTIYEKQMFTQGSSLSKIVDVIQLVLPVGIHILVIVEGFLKRNYDQKIHGIIDELERGFEEQATVLSVFNRQLKRWFFSVSAVVQIVSLAVEIYIISSITASPDWVRNWIARIFSFAYARLAMFHYIFTVDYLSSRLSVINSELLSVETYSKKIKFNANYDPYLSQKLVFLKRAHRDLWRLCELHNRRHSVFILGSMTSFFICLTIDFYWMYANVYYGDNIFIMRELNGFSK